MHQATFDFLVGFDLSLICFDDADGGDNYVVTDVPVSARVDQNGLAIYSPRRSGYARVQIDVLAERPDIDISGWDFAADLYVHTLGGLRVSSITADHIYDTSTREKVDGEISVEMGIYRVRVLIANYHQTVRRLTELRHGDVGEKYAEYHYLNWGHNSNENRFALPTTDFLMSCDHYRLLVTPVVEVSVLKSL